MFFENVNEAAKDPILGLSEEFNKDESSNKVNLAVGVYQDDNGKTTTFESVLEAEKILQRLFHNAILHNKLKKGAKVG